MSTKEELLEGRANELGFTRGELVQWCLDQIETALPTEVKELVELYITEADDVLTEVEKERLRNFVTYVEALSR